MMQQTRKSGSKRAAVSLESDRIELWRAATDAWKKLYREAEKNLSGKVGIGIAELRILRTLHDAGPSPMAKLSSEALLTQAAMTAIVDRLEEEGIVERVRSTEDRRVVKVAITRKGEDVYKEASRVHRRYIEESLEVLRDDELKALSSIMEKLTSQRISS